MHDVPDHSHVDFGELSRLYELLEEYGETLTEPTNRPLNVIIFEAFHRWEVKEIDRTERGNLTGDFDFIDNNNR